VADRISDERLREIASSDPLALAICAQMGEPSWSDVRAIAAELLAARADMREAMELLRAHGQPPNWMMQTQFGATKEWNRSYGKLLAKHKETP
jgi:membrane-bound lytic murein transglycosylase B